MAKITTKFREMYKRLNSEQREAVDTIEGPVMVVAGPGTGKTQILTLRIANILKETDADASSILALTFTESGAYTMRKRLVEIIGSEGYRVHIHTFHGFCNEVIKDNPDAFPRIIGATNITDIEKITLLKDVIDKTKLKILKPFGNHYFYLGDIRATLSNLKRENTNPSQLAKLVIKEEDEKKRTKLEELVVVYKAYEKRLASGKLYDYEDMIMEVIKALQSDKNLLQSLRENFQYILADEHQDANTGQNTLLELLSSYDKSPNLFIVGDEKQAIFRFQGASLENFLYFGKRFPSAKLIKLKTNYRSHQEILDASHSLMDQRDGVEDLGIRIKLEAHKKGGGAIKVRMYTRSEYEHRALALDIKDKLDSGVEPTEIAVLYRDNKDVEPLIRVFEKEDLPFVVESDQNVLTDPIISKLIIILRALSDYGNDEKLVDVLHIGFLGFRHTEIYKLIKVKSQKSKVKSLYERMCEGREFKPFAKKFESWRAFAMNNTLLDTIELVVRESGLLESVLREPETDDDMTSVSNFYDQVKSMVENHRGYTLVDLIAHIDLMLEHNVYLKRDTRRETLTNVRLMTAHRSKGLEFDYVYVIGAYDGHWGNRRARGNIRVPDLGVTSGDNDDERRLFYVALTRARKEAIISYSVESEDGRQLLPSQFINEIDEKLKIIEDTSDAEKKLMKNARDKFKPKKKPKPASADREYLLSVFEAQGLSVTGLNNYLACPWQWFYQNLIRIPRPQSKHAMYGNAVHGALKKFHDYIRHPMSDIMGDGAGLKAILLNFFKNELSKQPLTDEQLFELEERGERALSGYFDAYYSTWELDSQVGQVVTELDIRGVEFFGELDKSVRLRGKLDKVEPLEPSARSGRVLVTDYKTATPKSRNEIEGKTKTGSGEYKRQLNFYRILLDRFAKGKFLMEEGEIDFVEPNERGKYKREKFVIDEREVWDLELEITRVVNEIRNFGYWSTRCKQSKSKQKNKSGCEFCKLRDMMC